MSLIFTKYTAHGTGLPSKEEITFHLREETSYKNPFLLGFFYVCF